MPAHAGQAWRAPLLAWTSRTHLPTPSHLPGRREARKAHDCAMVLSDRCIMSTAENTHPAAAFNTFVARQRTGARPRSTRQPRPCSTTWPPSRFTLDLCWRGCLRVASTTLRGVGGAGGVVSKC